MARRSGLGQFVKAMAREAARQDRLRRQAERENARHLAFLDRESEKQFRQAERLERQSMRDRAKEQKEDARSAALAYVEQRTDEAARLCQDARERADRLASLLADTLVVDDRLSFDSLRVVETLPTLSLPRGISAPAATLSRETFLAKVEPLGFFGKLLPWTKARHEREIALALSDFEGAKSRWTEREDARLQAVLDLEFEHKFAADGLALKKAQRDAEVDAFAQDYEAGDPDAIVSYNTMVLERSVYPDDFPQNFSIAYMHASRQLVVEYELPGPDVVPTVIEYRYVKTRNEITEKARKPADIKADYRDVVAAVALRTLHEVFEADQFGHVETCCFNGYVHAVDPATGRDEQPHLVSVRSDRTTFQAINLARIDKAVCLRNLGANVSRQPDEAQPVRPIVEFDMADARFIDQSDLVSGLSSATNLMDLTPGEFETLVANTFGQMGLESKLTRSSRDGGVDCIAYDQRPILGGKVVIQAKRYRHTVGVSAVRDLYGTMMNEGANKGILVATSGYGPDAFNFAKDKPIELIDGGGLLFLLQEIGVNARIVFPEA